MKKIRYFAGLAGVLLLLLTVLLLSTCRRDRDAVRDDPTDTGGSSATDAVTQADIGSSPEETIPHHETAEPNETSQAESQEPAVPIPLTPQEAKALLSAALEKGPGQAAVTLRLYKNGELFAAESFVRLGEDFCVEIHRDGGTRRITAVGDRAYYSLARPKDFPPVDQRLVMTLDSREREELWEAYIEERGKTLLEDPALVEALLNCTLTGVRHKDGMVALTCTGLDGGLVEEAFGVTMQGTDLAFDLGLDPQVRVTYLEGRVSLSAGEEQGATATLEMRVDHNPEPISLPADAAAYLPTTYDEVFGVRLPEADPQAAAAAGMPLDRDGYTLMGGNYLYDPSTQYAFTTAYPHSYAGKSFTLYGVIMKDGEGQTRLSLGSHMEFALSFHGVAAPVAGAYVRLTAVYEKAGEGVDHTCYVMRVSTCEVLKEADGPNGGKLMYVTSAALNVRSSADTSAAGNIIGSLVKGDLVEVFEQDANGWYRVDYNGQTGYVSGRYLSQTCP